MKEALFWGISPAFLPKQHTCQSSYSVGRQPHRDSRAGEDPDKSLCLRDGPYCNLENLYIGE